jgi:hypothetical protein
MRKEETKMLSNIALKNMLDVLNDEGAELETRLNVREELEAGLEEINQMLINRKMFFSLMFDEENGYSLFMNDLREVIAR